MLRGKQAGHRELAIGRADTLMEDLAVIKGARILLVEDNEFNEEVAAELLKDAGFVVEVAVDGQVALEKVQQSPYDLVLMDVQMPVMDGVTATLEIRKFPRFRDLPIVAMTANAMQADRDRCLAAGMNDYLAKPIEPEELWKGLLKWVRPREGIGASLVAAQGAKPMASSDLPVDAPGLDVEAGLRRVLGKRPLYMSLLRKFVAGQKAMPGQVKQALDAEDWKTAERLAHTTKGVAGNIGAAPLQAGAAELEAAIREKQPRNTVDLLLAKVAKQLKELIGALDAKLPPDRARGAEGKVDPGKLKAVCTRLEALLTEDNAEAEDFVDENADLLNTAFPNHYRGIENLIRGFDFDGALAVLRKAVAESDNMSNGLTSPHSFTQKRTVLVVDDTPDNLSLLNGVLKDDYTVKVANSGARALQILQRDPPPDLVLLDVMMPGMDGYEVMRRVRADQRTRDLPVIFVTAMSETENEEKGLALGAVDYLTKPVSPPIVLARVRSHLVLSERTAMLRSLSEKLSRYLSPQVYKSIFEGAQDASIQAKRKKLTIFFSDIKDFTQTTKDLQPEDLTYLLNNYFSEMSKIALEYGATIDKFVGDAMLMFFGDPQTRGVREDALQCVRMAVSMQRRMGDLQAIWREKGYDRPFRMRIGINTGFCNVGNFGSDQRMDYTIIGAEVNLAARLEQLGEPDGVMLSYETYALVRDEFDAEERSPIQAKGISQKIRCFALKGIQETAPGERRFLVKERPGMRLTLNLEELTGEAREKALNDLQDVMERIRQNP